MPEDRYRSSSPGQLAHGQLCYIQLPAADLESAARFYERTFGWRAAPPQAGFEAPGLIGQWVTDRAAAPDAGPVLWFDVDDLERTLREAERAGGRIRQEPTPDGPRTLAAFTDPAGNPIGIAQHPRHAEPAREARGAGFNRTMPSSTIIPELVYEDVEEAVAWLCDKFGFAVRWQAGDHRAQLSLNDGTVVVTEPRTSNALSGPHSLLVRVPDVRAHHGHARDRGAKILDEPRDYPYGERQYAAEDLGGHHWGFSQSIADVAPEEWGGVSGPALQTARDLAGAHVSVMLIVPDTEAAISWYRRALGATELWNLGGVAGLQVHGGPFFLHEVNPVNPTENSPTAVGLTSVRVELFVDDPDALIERAVAAGATPGSAVEDHHHFPGIVHRQGGFRDPFGHSWSVGDKSPLYIH